jgi:large subunit ribosomal protein L30
MVYAVVRLKGTVHIREDVGRTLRYLRLNKKHSCVLLPETKEVIGMIRKIHNTITWGELNETTATVLISKRGRLPGNKRITDDYIKEKTGKTIEEFAKDIASDTIKFGEVPGLKPIFRLKPPSHGLERKGMTQEFSMGGSYGYRGEKINELLMRMI